MIQSLILTYDDYSSFDGFIITSGDAADVVGYDDGNYGGDDDFKVANGNDEYDENAQFSELYEKTYDCFWVIMLNEQCATYEKNDEFLELESSYVLLVYGENGDYA